MKKTLLAAFLVLASFAMGQQPQPHTSLKDILLQQLRETHNQKNWFVSEKEAVSGLTPERAAWNDGKNHSVGQLLQHLAFWNANSLARAKGEKPSTPDDNNQTFKFQPQEWNATMAKFDSVMKEWEDFVQSADDATLAKVAPMVARIAQHNAYHIGEMVTVRKAQGSWNPENGVK
jgi:hypothetical protein